MPAQRGVWWRWAGAVTIGVLQASSGIYYAFFAEYFLVVAAVAATLQRRSVRPLAVAGLLSLVTLIGLGVNVAPTLRALREEGRNPVVANRPLCDSEGYSLKLSAMLLPIPGHRIGPLCALRNWYDRETIAANESSWAALGLVASVGTVLLLGVVLLRRHAPPLIDALAVLNIFGILLGTTSGLGMLFSLLVTPQIRCQNRVSVYLAFFSLACVALLLQSMWDRVLTTGRGEHLKRGLLVGLVCAALWEQHPQRCRYDFPGVRQDWERDADFVKSIEAAAPAGAMILQLPYMTFPESAPVGQLDSYQSLRLALHSSSLRWSGGAMRGREADNWRRQVDELPLEEQVAAARAAGFAGVQVSRLGYADQGYELEQKLRTLVDSDPIVDQGETNSFFLLTPRQASTVAGRRASSAEPPAACGVCCADRRQTGPRLVRTADPTAAASSGALGQAANGDRQHDPSPAVEQHFNAHQEADHPQRSLWAGDDR